MAVIGHSSGTLARAIGLGGITNPIDNGEAGIGFFRFMMATGGTVRPHMGLIAATDNNPVNATNTADPKTVPAGFKLVDNGTGFDVVTLDGATVLKTGLPFAVADAGPLNGMIFANPISPTGSGQATRIHVDEIWWDGDQGLSKPTTAKGPRPADKAQDIPRDVILGWTRGRFAPSLLRHRSAGRNRRRRCDPDRHGQ